MAKLVLRIDRLVLRGVAAKQRDAVVQGLQAGLRREFARRELVTHWTASGDRSSVLDRAPCKGEGAALGAAMARRIAKGGGT